LRRIALALAAALAGASGLALETLLVDCAGLALGHGRSGALGLATFLSAWALGAFRAGKSRRDPRRDLHRTGALAALFAWPAVRLVLWAGGSAPPGLPAALLTLLSIGAIGFLQGAFLAPLARALAGEVVWLLAANLAGSAAGAFWISDLAVGALGRLPAALLAGAAAGAAGLVGGFGASLPTAVSRPTQSSPGAGLPANQGDLGWTAAGWIVALATAWVASLEWISLRLGVLWLGGMQPGLRAVLLAALIALALGAAIVPRIVPRGGAGVLWTLLLGCLGAVWPLLAARAIRVLGLESAPGLAVALVLVGPALLPFGGLVAVLHRTLPLESGERLGRLFLPEVWGALLGLPIVHLVLVPRIGLSGSIACLEGCGLLAILALFRVCPRAVLPCAALPVLLFAWASRQPPPALESPPLSNPAFSVRSFVEDRDFAVTVVDDGIGGERTLMTDGFRAAGTGAQYRYMRVLGHLPVLLAPHPRRVAVLALGTGTTVGAVAMHPEVERIDVLEISRAVVEAAPWFVEKNRGALDEGLPGLLDADDRRARVVVRLGDGRATLASASGTYDVITMEPLLPDSPFGVYLYTREFYGRARSALAPGGLLCQWVPPHALEPECFAAVLDAFASAFPWSSVWLSGTQAILIGGERAPALDPSRFPSQGGLRVALAELGLDTPAGLLARFVGDGARARGAVRRLSDADPWIVYRRRRSGPVLLADLPRNLAFLRSIGGAPPADWVASAGVGAERAIEGLAALRAAREAHARSEALLHGWTGEAGNGPGIEDSLARARALCPRDPEVADLEEEIAFLRDLRAGVSLLASDRTREGAEAALPLLLSAAKSRRERGDVHLYAAVALERLRNPAADRAVQAALDRCPAIARTPEGKRARELGLSDGAWSLAEASAARNEREFFTNRPSGKTSGVVTSDPP
jgi:spermidine synthase